MPTMNVPPPSPTEFLIHEPSSLESKEKLSAPIYTSSFGGSSPSYKKPRTKESLDWVIATSDRFCAEHGMEDFAGDIRKGALLAQNPELHSYDFLDIDEADALRNEVEHKWRQPWMLYYLITICSLAAANQGMDETVINGAQVFFPSQFGIDSGSQRDTMLLGVINSAPYLCCAVLGCWLTDPLNERLGRRGTIFAAALICVICTIWEGLTDSWAHLWAARFVLGLGIGPNSATVPLYAAECTPASIRGGLVMQWQIWTAFGIMIGFVSDLVFYKVPNLSGIVGLNWRIMLGSACLPAVILASQVWFCPESPRWLITKGRYRQAYQSLLRLRNHKIIAARDFFLIYTQLQEQKEVEVKQGWAIFKLFTVPRNRRATLASWIVMFGQQFCGINAVAYYSSSVFLNAGFSLSRALAASLGFGAINFVSAFGGCFTIDRFGRRSLLLLCFPLMSVFLLMTGLAFFIPGETSTVRIIVVAIGIYLFSAVYSPGEGAVPFTYSAEAFPISVRNSGMAFATATTWCFNFIVSLTFPLLLTSFKPQGAFGWYAAWCIVLWVAILLFVPETKGFSLEELDEVFSVRTRDHAAWGLRQIPYFIKRYLMGRNVPPEPVPVPRTSRTADVEKAT